MNTVLKLLLILLGFVLGGILGVVGLFVIAGLIDPSNLAWIWILAFVTAPVGAIAGSIFGFLLHKRFWSNEIKT